MNGNHLDDPNLVRLAEIQQARQAEMRMIARLERDLGLNSGYGKSMRARTWRRLAVAAAVALLLALAIVQFAGAAAAVGGGGGGGPWVVM